MPLFPLLLFLFSKPVAVSETGNTSIVHSLAHSHSHLTQLPDANGRFLRERKEGAGCVNLVWEQKNLVLVWEMRNRWDIYSLTPTGAHIYNANDVVWCPLTQRVVYAELQISSSPPNSVASWSEKMSHRLFISHIRIRNFCSQTNLTQPAPFLPSLTNLSFMSGSWTRWEWGCDKWGIIIILWKWGVKFGEHLLISSSPLLSLLLSWVREAE